MPGPSLWLCNHIGTVLADSTSLFGLHSGLMLQVGDILSSIPTDSLVALVCNFLAFAHHDLNLQYRTVTTYRSALRHPLLITCGVDINTLQSDLLLRGIFLARPPLKARPMPSWSLNQVLSFLDGPLFEPLETAEPLRLLQKALFLLMLATGRRISKVSSLSRQFQNRGDHLVLHCVPGFLPKHHTPRFMPSPPYLWRFLKNSSTPVNHCPVRALLIYVQRSNRWLVGRPPNLLTMWHLPRTKRPLSQVLLTKCFKRLVMDSIFYNDLSCSHVQITPHQVRKFAASYSREADQDEETVRVAMGFSSVSILRKNYQASVPPLRFPCVLPGGSFSPVVHAISSSDDE